MADRLTPEARKSLILCAAVRYARAYGLVKLTHSGVAGHCVTATSTDTVRHYFGTKMDLWQAVLAAEPVEFQQQGWELGL